MNKQQLEVKNYLMGAYYIDQRINSKLDQIASLNDLATKATSTISDMPGSPNRNVHKKEDIIVNILDLEREIQDDVNRLVDRKKNIVKLINQVDDPEGQYILEERYLNMSKWEQIASDSGHSIRQIFRIHDEMLKKIRIPESWQ